MAFFPAPPPLVVVTFPPGGTEVWLLLLTKLQLLPLLLPLLLINTGEVGKEDVEKQGREEVVCGLCCIGCGSVKGGGKCVSMVSKDL